ncbi:MAG: IPTL-CTERM sorting domain-containing protein [Ottowia sp.]|uniref:leucine-rich repeat domain-containing protein n=1 Tax=Ottowia sp. TaxID=1898956 RepID=UPI0039E3472F
MPRSTLWRRLLASIALAASVLPAAAAIPASERQVLLDLYAATAGAGWTNNTNWNGAAGTECTWFGVNCDAGEDHVTGVVLPANNLVGALPGNINQLTALVAFSVWNNQLSGSIPSLAGLVNLRAFAVNDNQLSGAIPPLSGLTVLTWFYVYNNQLSGPIPPLSGLTTLEYFSADGNRLSGAIPALTGLTALRYFMVHDNRLSGSMPSLDGLTTLERVFVHGNQLTGAPPAAPATLTAGYSRLCPNHLIAPSPTDAAWDAATGETPWSQNCTAAAVGSVAAVPTTGEWALLLLGMLAAAVGARRLRRQV